MTNPRHHETRHVRVDIHRDTEPIEGDVTGPDGKSTPFRGWLELTAELEEVRRGHREAPLESS